MLRLQFQREKAGSYYYKQTHKHTEEYNYTPKSTIAC